MEKLLAFHNDSSIKQRYLDRVRAHAAADEIVQGSGYWTQGKGCAVGCTIHGDNHAAYEVELGIPQSIARLEDGIFEGLPADLARTWPTRLLEAIPLGADLSQVAPRFLSWLLTDPEGMRRFSDHAGLVAIDEIAELYQRHFVGGEPSIYDWKSAAESARSAARRAARSAEAESARSAESAAESAWSAWSAARSARSARSAAWSAESAAEAARSAAESAARSARSARSAAWSAEAAEAAEAAARIRQSEKLLLILSSAPIPAVIG